MSFCSSRTGQWMGLVLVALIPACPGFADESYALPTYTIYSEQVANQAPVTAIVMPVSGLRFEPRVDVQARNLAEGQADVTIRGGTFEGTGFKLGAVSLYDPQTGHYFAEIPIAPAMLGSPHVLTGLDNAVAGFNAGVGTVAFGWRPVEQRGEVSVAAGDFSSNRAGLYQGFVVPGDHGKNTVAADIELARSESDGTVPSGDHSFWRVAGRIQVRGAQSQTDLFAGVQHKFFGWPNLYTPFGFNESEDLKTELYVFNHRTSSSPGNYWEVGACYRRNYDDYEFNRSVPGASNPFQHTTHLRSVALDGRCEEGAYAVTYSVQAMRDGLKSTALTYGRFNTRDYFKLSVVPQHQWETTSGRMVLRAGGTLDDTNRNGSAVSPIVGVELTRPAGLRLYLHYAEATQVPTYTALNSSATAGLFRGNAGLGRETSRNLEAGAVFRRGVWNVETAVFQRWDHGLADWTFRRGVTARTANAVDIGTRGFEIVATRRTSRCDLVLGFTWLQKDADYGSAAVDASFYALNFPRQRLTAAVVLRVGGGLELRLDNEYRVQEKNFLRVVGGNEALLSAAGLYWIPPARHHLEFSLLVDNLWDSDFQEVPAVPASRRQYSFGAAWRW